MTFINSTQSDMLNYTRIPVAAISLCDNCWVDLEAFFNAVSAHSEIAYILNTPDSAAMLIEKLMSSSTIPIKILGTEDIQLNTIYLLHEHQPQDIFFRDIAQKYTDFAMAVCINDFEKTTIAGFKAIKAAGGITFLNQVSFRLPETLFDLADFMSPIKRIPAQMHLLSSRFEKVMIEKRAAEVTLQKEELLRQKEFSDTVFNATVDSMFVCDKEFRLLAFNSAFKTAYDLDDSNLGDSLLDIYPEIIDGTFHNDLLQAIGGKVIHRHIYKSVVNGLHYEEHITPLKDATDTIYAALVVGSNINDRIEKEERLKDLNDQLQTQNDIFRHAEENAMIGSYNWEFATNQLHYSDNLFRLFGHNPNDFVPDYDIFLSMIHPDDLEQVKESGLQTLDSDTVISNTYRIITPKGEIKYCHSTGKFVGSNDDRKMIGTVQDVTSDILMKQMLQKQNIDLQNSNDDLASFNYIASHDLQEPLRKIDLFSSRILERDGKQFSEQSNEYFRRISSAISRMQNLIQALLSYSNTDPNEIKVAKTDLNKILTEVLGNLDEKIIEKNAVFTTQQLPTINAIPMQFQQLLLNLVSNALKYSKPGVAPQIDITSQTVNIEERNDEPYYTISIADNGIGFDQRYSNKIFDLFQRLHGKSEFEGTGVGLAICKKIASNHNGFITAKGTLGEGSIFTIYIPANN